MAPVYTAIQFYCVSEKIYKFSEQHFRERDKTDEIQTPLKVGFGRGVYNSTARNSRQ